VRWPRTIDLRARVEKPLNLIPDEGLAAASPPNESTMPETPWNSIGPTVKENVIVGGQSFVIERPNRSDHLLDDPTVRAAFAADEYLPYWTEIWPAARMLAKAIMRNP